jgi:hypothetical protein
MRSPLTTTRFGVREAILAAIAGRYSLAPVVVSGSPLVSPTTTNDHVPVAKARRHSKGPQQSAMIKIRIIDVRIQIILLRKRYKYYMKCPKLFKAQYYIRGFRFLNHLKNLEGEVFFDLITKMAQTVKPSPAGG